MAAFDVVLDTSALVAYAQNDLRSLPVDELLDELREDSGGAVIIGWFTAEDAQQVLGDDRPALARLQSLVAAHGVRLADADMRRTVALIAGEGQVSRGLAHAMLLSAMDGCSVATCAAATLRTAGFATSRILDLDAFFRD